MNNNFKALKILFSFLALALAIATVIYKFGMQGAVLNQNQTKIEKIDTIQVEQGKAIASLKTDVKNIKKDTWYIRRGIDEISKKIP